MKKNCRIMLKRLVADRPEDAAAFAEGPWAVLIWADDLELLVGGFADRKEAAGWVMTLIERQAARQIRELEALGTLGRVQ